MYRVKWMANPHPRDLWRVSVFSWLVQGSYLGGGAGLFLHPHPISQEGCSPCSLHWHTGCREQSGPRGGGRSVCPAHGRRTVKQELVARTNQVRLVSSSKTVCPTCRTHSDSRQFPGVNRPRKRAKSKQRKGLEPEYVPKQTRSNTALPVGSLTSSPKL